MKTFLIGLAVIVFYDAITLTLTLDGVPADTAAKLAVALLVVTLSFTVLWIEIRRGHRA